MSLPAIDFSEPGSAIRRTLRWDDAERKLIVHSFQECADVLAYNAAAYNSERTSSSLWAGRGYVKVASIPLGLAEQWMREGLSIYRREDRPKILQRLSSIEYQHLRTAPGRLA